MISCGTRKAKGAAVRALRFCALLNFDFQFFTSLGTARRRGRA